MEENKFDILEEVEQDIVVNNEELKRELKEYEKLGILKSRCRESTPPA